MAEDLTQNYILQAATLQEKMGRQVKYPYGVRYYSRTGHTKQIAEAIAAQLGCEAQLTSERMRGYTDILFLGGAVYAGKPDASLEGFIERLDRRSVGKIILFGDAAMSDPTKKIRKLLLDKGLLAETEVFTCKGSFKMIAKGHPNAQDLEDARAFARKWKQSSLEPETTQE